MQNRDFAVSPRRLCANPSFTFERPMFPYINGKAFCKSFQTSANTQSIQSWLNDSNFINKSAYIYVVYSFSVLFVVSKVVVVASGPSKHKGGFKKRLKRITVGLRLAFLHENILHRRLNASALWRNYINSVGNLISLSLAPIESRESL